MAAAPSSTEDTRPSGIRRPRWHPLEIAFWVAPIPAFFVLSDRRQLLESGLHLRRCSRCRSISSSATRGSCRSDTRPSSASARTRRACSRGTAGPSRSRGSAPPALVAGAFGYAVSFLVVPGADLTRLMVTLGIGLLDRRGGQSGVVDHRRRRRARRTCSPRRCSASSRSVSTARRRVSTASRSWRWCSCWRGGSFIRRSVCRCAGSARTRGACPRSARTSTAACARSSRCRPRWPAWQARLLAQTTRFVGIDTLGFQRSAELLIILAFGGTGRLYGALLGATVFMRGAGRARRGQPRVLAVLAGRRAGPAGACSRPAG